MTIKKLVPNDADRMTEIHMNSFKGFFLTSLGFRFLVEFYRALLNHSLGLGVGIHYNGQLIGFAVGTTQERGFYKQLLRSNVFGLLQSALIPLFKKPSKILYLLNSLKGGARSYIHNSGSLLSICIDSTMQKNGAGKKLITAFEYELKNRGCKSVSLTTDTDNNDKVNYFYTGQGYNLIEVFTTANGRSMNLFLKELI
ncbi:MAG: ribosomal protein S18 acetylase RimI-like enzyme [Parvicella sp.]|jgi:ribosomal protein S18 acetylase RimI-like enzyme